MRTSLLIARNSLRPTSLPGFRFLSFGGGVPYRPAEDLAFAVARFFQRGGTFQNYYMVRHGVPEPAQL